MTNEQIDRKLAELLEPEPKDIDSPDTLWVARYGDGRSSYIPARFTTDHNAFALLWARLTEEQQKAVIKEAIKESPGTWTTWSGDRLPSDPVSFGVFLKSSLPSKWCWWVLRALEGK